MDVISAPNRHYLNKNSGLIYFSIAIRSMNHSYSFASSSQSTKISVVLNYRKMNPTPSNSFRLRANGNKFILVSPAHEPAKNERTCDTRTITSERDKSNQFSVQQSSFADFDNFFEKFEQGISTMQLQQKQIDKIYLLCEDLIKHTYDIFNLDSSNSAERDYIINKLKAKETGRKRRTILRSDEQYLAPQEIPIGLKWKAQKEAGNDILNHKLVQTTFQYVPISDTLRTLFKNPDFEKMYLQYNDYEKHVCKDSIYQDFCCSSNSKKFEIFQIKNTLQVQLGIDDFEPCNALKTKAGKHKMCGVYFHLRNIPENYRSKLSNIFLVALVKTEDVKGTEKLYEEVFKLIVDDLKNLETNGIQISSGINLKGALVNISCDNLGANSVFGFAESFNCHYYCRMCECDKSECKKMVRENSEKIRGKQRYSNHLQKIPVNTDDDCDLKLTKGVKKYCPFNDLKYFHILDNSSIDIMHDIYEGVIPFFLRTLFTTLLSIGVSNFTEIQAKIRDFDYGILNKKSYPSNIKLKRNNLGQCAAQSYNLICHTPFMFAEYRLKIPSLWKAMENLLQILQIIHSTSVSDDDIHRLKSCVEQYLSYLVDECQVKLTPKHHNMTHYPTVFRKMGPLIHMWMMRMECKHKTFTDMVRRTNNYKNLPKTLALQHQEIVWQQKDMYKIHMDITPSKSTYNIVATKNFDDYKFCMPPLHEGEKLFGHRFVKFGSYEYRPGLMVIDSNKVFEIIHIFQYQNQYLILCHAYISLDFEFCYNSLEISKDCTFSNSRLFLIDDMKIKKSYEKITKCGKIYIYADTLDVFNKF